MFIKISKVSLLLAFFCMSAFADNVDINGQVQAGALNAELRIAGLGSWVCSAEDSMNDIPVLGRGQTEREAQAVALQECARAPYNDAFFCKVITCERDRKNNSLSAIFDISRDSTNINIHFRGKTKFACYIENRMQNKIYVAKAATKTEGLALAKSTCAQDEGLRLNTKPDGFFCKPQSLSNECEQISGSSGSINIGDLIGGAIRGRN